MYKNIHIFMYGHMYIYKDIHICMYMDTYVCMYVHTCCVLIKPPMPYITSSRCKRLHKFRPVQNLLHERGYPRAPPCKPLK